LSGAGAGKPFQENTVFVLPGEVKQQKAASHIIKAASHTAGVLGVTDGDYVTLVMFRYSASSIFRTCDKLLFRGGQLSSRPVSAELTFLEDTRCKKILNGWRKRQPAKGLIAIK